MPLQGSSPSPATDKVLAIWRQYKDDVDVEAQYTPSSTVDGSSFTRIRSGQGSLKITNKQSDSPTAGNCTFERTSVSDKTGKKRIDYAILIINTNEKDGTIQKRIESESFPVDVLRKGNAIVSVASEYGFNLTTAEKRYNYYFEIKGGFAVAPDDSLTVKTVRLLEKI
jgi:hypothetical protein